ncbi:hypothetical protein ACWD01_37220, partial [Streptomyces sp. NPDC002835]
MERRAARIRFLHWLRQAVEVDGPTLSLVTGSQDARELMAPLVRAEYPFVMTWSEEEPTASAAACRPERFRAHRATVDVALGPPLSS